MINVNIEKQRAEFVNLDFDIVENSENLYTIKFTFSTDWEGFKRYAVFKNLSCCHEVQKEINDDNTVLIPNEILKTSGILKVGVFGYFEDTFKPTLYTENAILIKRGVNINADNPHDFEPSEFLKLLKDINTVKADLSEHINNYDNPHKVTKTQIGLANVENKSSSDIINEIKIGSRNLLKDTAKLSKTVIGREWTIVDSGLYNYLSIDTTGALWNECGIPFYTKYGEVVNEVTISFDFYESVPDVLAFTMSAYDMNGNRLVETRNIFTRECKITNIGGEWQRATFKITSTQLNTLNKFANGYSYHLQFKTPRGAVGQAKVRYPKVERGNKATDWSPAPEDTEIKITNIEERMSTLEATIMSLGGET